MWTSLLIEDYHIWILFLLILLLFFISNLPVCCLSWPLLIISVPLGCNILSLLFFFFFATGLGVQSLLLIPISLGCSSPWVCSSENRIRWDVLSTAEGAHGTNCEEFWSRFEHLVPTPLFRINFLFIFRNLPLSFPPPSRYCLSLLLSLYIFSTMSFYSYWLYSPYFLTDYKHITVSSGPRKFADTEKGKLVSSGAPKKKVKHPSSSSFWILLLFFRSQLFFILLFSSSSSSFLLFSSFISVMITYYYLCRLISLRLLDYLFGYWTTNRLRLLMI